MREGSTAMADETGDFHHRVVGDFHYRVVGSWPFPLDMLRRDGSRAASPEDQARIDRLSAEYAPDRAALREDVEIRLVIPDATRRQRPLTARWESFRWSVPDDGMHAHGKRLRRERTLRDDAYGRALLKLTPEELAAVRWHARGETER